VADLFRILVQFLHVFAGILWIGGGLYTLFVQTPALLAAPAPVRGAAIAQIAPRQIRYLLRLGEITIGLGILNLFVSGRAQQLQDLFGSRWAIAMAVGALLAVLLLALGHAVLKPAVSRLLEVGPRAGSGDAAAAAESATILARLRRMGYAQIVLGVAIVFAMVLARFS
jgi:uncharacterized membrane protein